jgi:hypothetical protein
MEKEEHTLLTPPPRKVQEIEVCFLAGNTGKEGGEERGGGFYNWRPRRLGRGRRRRTAVAAA